MEESLYRESVKKLMNRSLTFEEKLGDFALGLVCETGELIEKLSNGSEEKEVVSELGDTRWYLTANMILLDIPDFTGAFALPARKGDTEKLFITSCKYGDLIKKVIYHKHPLEQHSSQLHNFLWQYYVEYRHIISMWGFTDSQIKQANVDKLSVRYDGLIFTTEQSVNRKN